MKRFLRNALLVVLGGALAVVLCLVGARCLNDSTLQVVSSSRVYSLEEIDRIGESWLVVDGKAFRVQVTPQFVLSCSVRTKQFVVEKMQGIFGWSVNRVIQVSLDEVRQPVSSKVYTK